MTFELLPIPAGPAEKYNASQDLLTWLESKFNQYGGIYRASIYGTNAYVVSDPQYVDHILRKNWQNYRKGQTIKRVGLLLGNGLMVSEGEFWKSQRRMVQPAFHDKVISELIKIIKTANLLLLKKWMDAAEERRYVNITCDISRMTIDIVLRSIFGVDYEEVAPEFNVLVREKSRNLEFAQSFKPLGKTVTAVVALRRKQNRRDADMLGLLMETSDQKTGRAMPDGQLVKEIMTLIVAGHETTASTLNWTWYLLSQNSEVEEKLTCELDSLLGKESNDYAALRRYTVSVRASHLFVEFCL